MRHMQIKRISPVAPFPLSTAEDHIDAAPQNPIPSHRLSFDPKRNLQTALTRKVRYSCRSACRFFAFWDLAATILCVSHRPLIVPLRILVVRAQHRLHHCHHQHHHCQHMPEMAQYRRLLRHRLPHPRTPPRLPSILAVESWEKQLTDWRCRSSCASSAPRVHAAPAMPRPSTWCVRSGWRARSCPCRNLRFKIPIPCPHFFLLRDSQWPPSCFARFFSSVHSSNIKFVPIFVLRCRADRASALTSCRRT